MIGVNSFKVPGEGLNFAVSIAEVRRFLDDAAKGAFDPKPVAARKEECTPKVLSDGRADQNDASIRRFDYFCNGKETAQLIVPDDKSKPIELVFDANGDGNSDGVIYDRDRDGKWDVSYWDTDFDGRVDPRRTPSRRRDEARARGKIHAQAQAVARPFKRRASTPRCRGRRRHRSAAPDRRRSGR